MEKTKENTSKSMHIFKKNTGGIITGRSYQNVQKVAQNAQNQPNYNNEQFQPIQGDFQISKIQLKQPENRQILINHRQQPSKSDHQASSQNSQSQSSQDQQLLDIEQLFNNDQQQIPPHTVNQENLLNQTNLQQNYIVPDYTINKNVPFNQLLQKDIAKLNQKQRRKKQQQVLRIKQRNQRIKNNNKLTQEELQLFKNKQTLSKHKNKNKKSRKNKITNPQNVNQFHINQLQTKHNKNDKTIAKDKQKANKNDTEIPITNKIQPNNHIINQSQPQQQTKITQFLSKQFFQGKLSIVWLFIIKNLQPEQQSKIKSLYQHIIDSSYIIPLCKNVEEALKFLKARNSVFKIVIDLENFNQLMEKQNFDMRIFQIYLYNNDKQNGLKRALQCKKKSLKLRKIQKDLSFLLQAAQYQINGKNFVQGDGQSIQQVPCRSRLPTYIQLSDTDKSDITKYRMSLYGAIKLQDQSQRKSKLQQFQKLVTSIYNKDPQQLQNLKRYLSQIDHISSHSQNEQKYHKVLRFYVQQTFYYKYLNNMLRICRTPQQFKPVMIPFNQNYHSLKYFYQKSLQQNNNKIQQTTLYRIAPIRRNDLKMLKPNNYIQLLGFISTSKDKKYVLENFYKSTGDYLFIIHIKGRVLTNEVKKLDHGFLDLDIFNIAGSGYENQKEVLFNALNIFKVLKVLKEQDSQDGIGIIQLQYGSIFQLYQKQLNNQTLTPTERGILKNYQYCVRLFDQIQDHGDVLMKSQEYDKCKQYYQQKLLHEQTVKNYNKLAQAQFYCGQDDNAVLNAIKSLKKFQQEVQNIRNLDRKKCMKLFQIHEKNAEILLSKEDTYHAYKAINFELALLDDQKDWFLKALKLKERGQLHFKQGKLIQSQNDLKQGESILLNKISQFQRQRLQIQRKYYWKKVRNFCCFGDQQLLSFQKQQQLKSVAKEQSQVLSINTKIQQLLLGINESILNVVQFIGDRKGYQQCVCKGRQYFGQLKNSMSENQTNDDSMAEDPFQTAKIKVLQAKIENALKEPEHVEKSYDLMEAAITIIEQVYPMHQKIGQYCTILGNFKKNELSQSYLLPKKQLVLNKLSKSRSSRDQSPIRNQITQRQNQESLIKQIKPNTIIPQTYFNGSGDLVNSSSQESLFDYKLLEQKYQNARYDLEKALVVTSYNLTLQHPKVFQLRNSLAELHYQYSRLKQSNQQAQTVLQTVNGPKHSEGAKSALLLAKIHLSRGEIKSAFKYVEKSRGILYSALVKETENFVYLKLFESSPIYTQIQLWRCKIYNRQMRHDLALDHIIKLQDLAKSNIRNVEGVGFLADIYQQRANTLIHQNQVVEFQEYFKKAIKLRQIQMGRDNIPNALSYCSLFKFLLFVQDIQSAQQYLQNSLLIFSRFANNHPNLWVQYASMSYLQQRRQNTKSQLEQIRQSLNLIQKRFSKNNINYLKLRIRFIQSLNRNRQYDEAFFEIDNLQKDLEEDIKESQKQEEMPLSQKDDEKLMIKSRLQVSLRDTEIRHSKFLLENTKSNANLNSTDNQLFINTKTKRVTKDNQGQRMQQNKQKQIHKQKSSSKVQRKKNKKKKLVKQQSKQPRQEDQKYQVLPIPQQPKVQRSEQIVLIQNDQFLSDSQSDFVEYNGKVAFIWEKNFVVATGGQKQICSFLNN